jgi:hypothetical protein
MIETRPFYLKRKEDETGISGTGIVALGAEFYPSGVCVLKWITPTSSLGVYDNVNEMMEIHGHGGKTEMVYGNPPKQKGRKKKVVDGQS